MAQGSIPEIEIGSHVGAFVRERLTMSNGSSLAAGELRVAFEGGYQRCSRSRFSSSPGQCSPCAPFSPRCMSPELAQTCQLPRCSSPVSSPGVLRKCPVASTQREPRHPSAGEKLVP